MKELNEIPLFKGLDQAELTLISKRINKKNYPKGSIVFTEGQDSDGLYIISSGVIKVLTTHKDGREKTFEILQAGQWMGEVTLFGSSIRSATVETLEPTSFLIISPDNFKHLLIEIPNLAIQILETLSNRLREANRQIQGLVFLNSRSRVICNLINLAEVHGKTKGPEIEITIRLTHAELAKFAGVSRETVTKVLLELQEKLLIKVYSKHIKVLNMNNLQSEVI